MTAKADDDCLSFPSKSSSDHDLQSTDDVTQCAGWNVEEDLSAPPTQLEEAHALSQWQVGCSSHISAVGGTKVSSL